MCAELTDAAAPGDPRAPRTQPPARWNDLFEPYRHPITSRSVIQLLSTSIAFVAIWWAMLGSLDVSYALTLLLSLPAACLLVRLFVLFHDCVHGSLFRSHAANVWVGRILGVATLTPFDFWRRNHVLHHATSGNLDERGFGDVETLTVREYLARSRSGRLRYRLARNPVLFLLFGPIWIFLLRHRLPLGMPKGWRKEWTSVLWNDLALAAVIAGFTFTVGFGRFISVHALIFYGSAIIGLWLFYVQHQFEDTYWVPGDRWDFAQACLRGSSMLEVPRPLRWATANIEVHHVHHLCPAIPSYRLRECLSNVKELPPPRRLGFRQSLRCARLALWDEQAERLVAFRDVLTPAGA